MGMIQATFFTMKWGLFTMSTGRQEVNSVNKSQPEEAKQAPDRESGKKRDSKKVVHQRGPT